ncbi:hypothetical protein WM40_00935 [Robbsia andropogonis]|uniref:Uncharacterized protein n=1 Tax=Robbsia andropogonis TaxID=28092 RepID=A0A0F5K6S2_9BURK|nr:EscF/YscF/HrpA family type III secretion system needle major subunit [Robbsia andropogonis]KKB65232.1 hypothetical protein WM40_00935 [Robbsia andropogonis]MCP1117130.1 EscF/YscF/HrpA family type III secretion system needle major subunit [Robbsia andropogonis]MCP1128476.1 EscF/YscF/HrpA family type III secretion system needle major subunit [Robbsia andropogonis]
MATFSPDGIINSLGSTLTATEADMNTFITQPNLSTSQLLQFQGLIGKWSLMSNLSSTLIKNLYDAFGGIVQKMA